MAIQNIAMSAYKNAQDMARTLAEKRSANLLSGKEQKTSGSFTDAVTDSLKTVNNMEKEKDLMIEEFASGKTENVHELMISLQKTGLALKMTSAVRNKVMEAYKELSKMTF